MRSNQINACTAFCGHSTIASGSMLDVAVTIKKHKKSPEPILTFDDKTGRVIDLDCHGTLTQIKNRYRETPENDTPEKPRGRGRPKLGVVGHEVTLLPRHWEWLQQQPGGASVALRKLVEQARRDNREADLIRGARDAINKFIYAIAGNLPGCEEANRALYAGDRRRFDFEIELWPEDIKKFIDRFKENSFLVIEEEKS